MTVQTITWVLEEAPITKPSHLPVLLALANEADSNGEGAFPSQRTLSWQTRKTERAVRKDLDALQAEGLIRRGDQARAAYIPPDRRPIVWNLAIERTRDMSKRPTKRPASGWDGIHRATDDVDRTEPEGTTVPPGTEPQVKTGGTVVPPGTPGSNRGELQGRTGGNHSSADPTTNPTTDTHPGTAQTDSTAKAETDTGVCVGADQRETLKKVISLNLVSRAPASIQGHRTDLEHAALAKAEACLNEGATIDHVDAALAAAINHKTTNPHSHGLNALQALLERARNTEGPLAAPKSTQQPEQTTRWVWPSLKDYNRPCRGFDCNDHYIPIDRPRGEPFTCPTCKDAFANDPYYREQLARHNQAVVAAK